MLESPFSAVGWKAVREHFVFSTPSISSNLKELETARHWIGISSSHQIWTNLPNDMDAVLGKV